MFQRKDEISRTFIDLGVHFCRRKNYAAILRKVCERNVRSANILDIGCGDGRLCHELQRYVFGLAIGIDLVDEIFAARRKYREVEYVKADAHYLPFIDDMFGFVVSSCALEHMDEPKQALTEVRRVLDSSGTAIIVVPSPVWHFSNVLEILACLILGSRLKQFIKNEDLKEYIRDVRERFRRERFGVFLHEKVCSHRPNKYRKYTVATEIKLWRYIRWIRLFHFAGLSVRCMEGVQLINISRNLPSPLWSLERKTFFKHLCHHYLFVLSKPIRKRASNTKLDSHVTPG